MLPEGNGSLARRIRPLYSIQPDLNGEPQRRFIFHRVRGD